MWEAKQTVRYFKASELPEPLKGTLLNAYTEFRQGLNNREFECSMRSALNKVFDDTIVLRYDLGYSQGDGASFLPKDNRYTIEQLLDLVKRADAVKEEDGLGLYEAQIFGMVPQVFDLATVIELNLVKEIIDKDGTEPYIKFEEVGRYCHQHSVATSLEEDNWYDLEEEMATDVFTSYNEWLDSIYRKFEKLRLKICNYIEKEGYEYIYEEVTIADLDEDDSSRGVVYTEDGIVKHLHMLEEDGVVLTEIISEEKSE
jgi:hypothetical protein